GFAWPNYLRSVVAVSHSRSDTTLTKTVARRRRLVRGRTEPPDLLLEGLDLRRVAAVRKFRALRRDVADIAAGNHVEGRRRGRLRNCGRGRGGVGGRLHRIAEGDHLVRRDPHVEGERLVT